MSLDRARRSRPAGLPSPRLLLLASIAAVSLAAPLPAQVKLYEKKATLQATMLAARARLTEWQQSQAAARQAVKIGGWQRAKLGPGEKLTAGFPSASPRWITCPSDRSGNVLLPREPGDLLTTTLTAAKPVTLTIEIGRLERFGGFAYRPSPSNAGVRRTDALVWLNGRQVPLDDKLEGYAAVPVAKRRGWHDVVLIDLPLVPGANRLLVSLRKGAASWFTAVRIDPQPVPALWAMIENDFPRDRNRLLESIPQAWFDAAAGWFARSAGPRLETQFLDEMLAQLAADAAGIRPRLDQLKSCFETSRASFPSPLAGEGKVRGTSGNVDHFSFHPSPPTPLPQGERGVMKQLITEKNAPAQDAAWLDLCVTAAELRAGLSAVDSLAAAVKELARGYPNRYPGERLLAHSAQLRQRLLCQAHDRLDPDQQPTADLLSELDQLKREALVVENPLLSGKRLLFVKRYTYDSNHYYDEFIAGIRRFGGGLYLLSADRGTVVPVAPQLSEGIVDRYDLSFDARGVLFDYKPPRPQGFRIYEVGIDGAEMRQLTFPAADEKQRIAHFATSSWQQLEKDPCRYGHWTDDMHPCYLPDGGIAFTSTRGQRGVLCGGHSLTVTNLCRLDAGQREPRPLSQGALSEFCPTVMNDGRILYNRWEYVDKGAGAVQSLWAMMPDGSQSEEIYGDNIGPPSVFNQARHVPGHNNLVVCLGAGHSPGNVGAIMLVDLHKNKGSAEAMTALTPGSVPKGNWGLRQFRNGQWMVDIYGPWYCDPFPLTDAGAADLGGKFFLVSCNPAGMWNDPAGYGIYLLDVFGNRVPIYADPQISCWQARPLEPRAIPPAPAGASQYAENGRPDEATLTVTDVYRGLDGVRPGAVKYLRVMEQVPRPWSVYDGYQGADAAPGEMVAISLYTHLSIKVLHGVVPVRADGSASFTVPANRNIFLEALDADYMEIQRMRTFVNSKPGEWRSCIGCHEQRNLAPVNRTALALQQPPVRPQPQPGDSGPRPLHYPTDIQPIFDRHCVSCHGEKRRDGDLDLSGQMTRLFSKSYEEIIRKDLVNYIQEFVGPKPEAADAMGYAPAVRPYTYGSHTARLIAVLRQGHYDVKLSREEFIRLATWVDANAPYYGSYFGRRNIVFRDRPDFRPVPTLQSALGL